MKTHDITVLPGDGIGPEIMKATLAVLEATGLSFNWDVQPFGQEATDLTDCGLPLGVIRSIKRNRIAIKGPTATPVGGGARSLNVALREQFELYANVRPIRTMPGVTTRFSDTAIDMVIFRENLEDLYIGEEREIPGGAEAISRITGRGSRRIAQFAYEYAREHGRRTVTTVHKSNILKKTHGLFLRRAQEVATINPSIISNDLIADNFAMQMVQRPERFDCVLLPNFLGDIASDLAAGLIGGLGFAPGANIGHYNAVFEAVHGTAPDIAGQNKANPTSLILSGAMMLDDLDETAAAKLVRDAVDAILLEGKTVTGDVPNARPESVVGTIEFGRAVADKVRAMACIEA